MKINVVIRHKDSTLPGKMYYIKGKIKPDMFGNKADDPMISFYFSLDSIYFPRKSAVLKPHHYMHSDCS